MKLAGLTSGMLLGFAGLVTAGWAGMHVSHLIESVSRRHWGEAALLAALAFAFWAISRRDDRQRSPKAVDE